MSLSQWSEVVLSHAKAKQKQKVKSTITSNNSNNNKETKNEQKNGRRLKNLAKQPRYVKSELFVTKPRKARSSRPP